MLWIDVLGWVAMVLLLAAYCLVSSKRLDGAGIPYQLLNVIGAVFLVINSGYYQAYPSASLNVIWVFIGLATIARRLWAAPEQPNSDGHG